jgi:hypothetical protein
MATILEQLALMFPSAELHVLHLAIDQSASDIDSAIAHLISWGCDFEPQAVVTQAATATTLRPPPPSTPPHRRTATSYVPRDVSGAVGVPRDVSGAVGSWTSQTLISWGLRPWLAL